ncbi:hypothetical protein K2P97_11285 [bacterium]|nr:hypothetical protein [bacterium]
MIKPLLSSSLQRWIELRNQPLQKKMTLKDAYWFHASSGEIEYCKSVIRLLKEKKPQSQIVVSYSSPSAEKLFHNIGVEVDQFIPMSWDQPAQINDLIDYINPRALIFSRTDLWPELIVQCQKRNIKLGIVSFLPKFGLMSLLINKCLLPRFNFISCTNESSRLKLQINFDNLNIFADGDTRYDQVFYRLSQKPRISFQKSDYKILVCGSTWIQDQKVLFAAFKKLKQQNYKIILSPHEVSAQYINPIRAELKTLGLSYTILSESNDPHDICIKEDVFIIDKVGFLPDCYRIADCAFIGGSFKDKIHSVMEALCCGLAVVCGPHYLNNPEAIKYKGRFVFPVEDELGLLDAILNSQTLQKDNILDEVKQNQNASLKVLNRILSLN